MSDKTVALPEARKHAGFLKANLREYGMLLSLFAIMLFFEFVTDGTLLRPLNLTNLVLQNSYIVIMALGMLLVIVTGHIDLSVGSVAGFIGAIAAVLMVRYDMHFIPASIACLALGALIGAAQGYWVAYFKIPSFIVTLAGMLVFKGLALAVLQGQSVGPFSPTFQKLSSGFIPELFPDAEDRHAIVHHPHDQRADHRAGHPPDAAIGRGAADEAGGDDVKLEAGPGFRRCGVEPRGEHEASERGQHAHVDKGEEGQPLGLDAGEFCRLLIAADRIDLPADCGARCNEAIERDQCDHDHQHVGQAAMRGDQIGEIDDHAEQGCVLERKEAGGQSSPASRPSG